MSVPFAEHSSPYDFDAAEREIFDGVLNADSLNDLADTERLANISTILSQAGVAASLSAEQVDAPAWDEVPFYPPGTFDYQRMVPIEATVENESPAETIEVPFYPPGTFDYENMRFTDGAQVGEQVSEDAVQAARDKVEAAYLQDNNSDNSLELIAEAPEEFLGALMEEPLITAVERGRHRALDQPSRLSRLAVDTVELGKEGVDWIRVATPRQLSKTKQLFVSVFGEQGHLATAQEAMGDKFEAWLDAAKKLYEALGQKTYDMQQQFGQSRMVRTAQAAWQRVVKSRPGRFISKHEDGIRQGLKWTGIVVGMSAIGFAIEWPLQMGLTALEQHRANNP